VSAGGFSGRIGPEANGRSPLCGGAGFDSQALPPFDPARAAQRASLMASHSTRAREGHRTDGPRRMALSDPERVGPSTRVWGESKGQTSAPATSPCFVYIVVCFDGAYSVDSTSDLRERERLRIVLRLISG
jgi:hypothetical protein